MASSVFVYAMDPQQRPTHTCSGTLKMTDNHLITFVKKLYGGKLVVFTSHGPGYLVDVDDNYKEIRTFEKKGVFSYRNMFIYRDSDGEDLLVGTDGKMLYVWDLESEDHCIIVDIGYHCNLYQAYDNTLIIHGIDNIYKPLFLKWKTLKNYYHIDFFEMTYMYGIQAIEPHLKNEGIIANYTAVRCSTDMQNLR